MKQEKTINDKFWKKRARTISREFTFSSLVHLLFLLLCSTLKVYIFCDSSGMLIENFFSLRFKWTKCSELDWQGLTLSKVRMMMVKMKDKGKWDPSMDEEETGWEWKKLQEAIRYKMKNYLEHGLGGKMRVLKGMPWEDWTSGNVSQLNQSLLSLWPFFPLFLCIN